MCVLIIVAHNTRLYPITTSYNCFKLLTSFRMQNANSQSDDNVDPYSHPRQEDVELTPAVYGTIDDTIAVSAPTYENTRREP